MEADSGAKIAIRGKGSVKEGKGTSLFPLQSISACCPVS